VGMAQPWPACEQTASPDIMAVEKIGVVQDDGGRFSAELEEQSFEGGRSFLHDALPHRRSNR
jgi:hypothetical protein